MSDGASRVGGRPEAVLPAGRGLPSPADSPVATPIAEEGDPPPSPANSEDGRWADRVAAAGDPTVSRAETLLVVVGRGTNDLDANSNTAKLACMLSEGMGFGWAEIAFSGVAYPRVDAALTRAARLGFRRIIVFPYFLFTGVLVKRVYAQTDAAARLFPEIEFVKALYLRDHPEVLDSFNDRVGELHEGSRQ